MDEILIDNQGFEFLCKDISQPEGFEFPTVRSVYVDPPNRSGTIYINALPGRRILAWRGLIKDDIGTNRRLLAVICHPGNLKTLKFTTCDGLALQAQVEINGLLNPYKESRCPYQLEFTAPDYRFYSQEEHITEIVITVLDGGTPIPAAIPAPIPGTTINSITLVNSGNAISNPVWVIRGPGKDFVIENLDTGEKFTLELTLTADEEVIIDPTNQLTPVLKGEQNVFGSLTRDPNGTWIGLNPGNNRILFRAQSGTNSNTLLTVKWRDAYGGI